MDMSGEILSCVGLFFAVATWFGLRPRHVREVAKRLSEEHRRQSILVTVMVIEVTGLVIYSPIHMFLYEDIEVLREIVWVLITLCFIFILGYCLFALGYPQVLAFLEQRHTLRTGLWAFYGLCAVAAIVIWGITSDNPIWLRIVLPIGSIIVGYAIGYVSGILEAKNEK